jgi:hypothetical protein
MSPTFAKATVDNLRRFVRQGDGGLPTEAAKQRWCAWPESNLD